VIIKVLLIAAAMAFGILILREKPTGSQQALLRMAGIGVTMLGIVAVLWPDTTVWAAELVGVKRGTDLVLYIFVMTFLFTTLASFQRMHRLENKLTDLAREVALRDEHEQT
jgi:small membrane protein